MKTRLLMLVLCGKTKNQRKAIGKCRLFSEHCVGVMVLSYFYSPAMKYFNGCVTICVYMRFEIMLIPGTMHFYHKHGNNTIKASIKCLFQGHNHTETTGTSNLQYFDREQSRR